MAAVPSLTRFVRKKVVPDGDPTAHRRVDGGGGFFFMKDFDKKFDNEYCSAVHLLTHPINERL